ncbi:glycoside hydrolase family 35 protein [Aerococcus viridans]|uniref:glycoside hydrolase family 35 protein n=1 Tax=Aerococcus urinaeequi TaxID=51665 RepID=UPI003AAE15A5
MATFEVKDEFLLDGQPFKILSGAIHYFRIHPDDWYHSLFNLKALGFNTVETYVPWNMHEAKEGEYNFSGILDIEKFISTAEELGLYVIIRPSPYICAEWEFGGFPAWLLNKDVHIRSSDTRFLDYVARYYDHLIPKLAAHQLKNGGNILMFQVENEYGSYGEDKVYLRMLTQMLKDYGIKQPLFTSDGPWRATLRAGSLIEDDILVTGNFGSKPEENFQQMKKFFDEYDKDWPLMCMEFWDGWFNRYGEEVVTRETDELVDSIKRTIELGSINLYMFHGGTNFGFMNGCSARLQHDLPQVTSYDYGAPLDEQGNPTEKYFAIQNMMKEYFPEYETKEPLVKNSLEILNIPLVESVSLLSVVDDLVVPRITKYPQTMEALDQNIGYVLYQTKIECDSQDGQERIRVIDGRDRIQLFANGKHVLTQYQEEIGEDIMVMQTEKYTNLSILVENMGRVNYGHKLLASTQRKGIRTGVTADLHFITNWRQYSLDFDDITKIDYSKEFVEGQPSFYKYEFMLTSLADTYVETNGFGKGIVFINGNNIGRFWDNGPYQTLYVPKGFLNEGKNEIVFFETEGKFNRNLNLVKQHEIMN